MQRQATATDARLALLGGLIDHAALFPPASMSMRDALAEDRRAGMSRGSFMLGRFVVRASEVGRIGPAFSRELSVLLDGPVPADPRVGAVETTRPDELSSLAGLASRIYVELPLNDSLERGIAGLADLDLAAKVRCGGRDTPTVRELARFLQLCRAEGVACKATAGLHHAVRGEAEHGFLNLLAAVVFGDEESALSEREPSAFALGANWFRWRGREAGPDELEPARERLHAIGSCSFFEPVQELEALGMLA